MQTVMIQEANNYYVQLPPNILHLEAPMLFGIYHLLVSVDEQT